MPWRLMLFLLIMTAVVAFIGLNLQNASDISFGFIALTGIPIFISLFVAFLLGTFVMLPFSIGKRRGRGDRDKGRGRGRDERAGALPAPGRKGGKGKDRYQVEQVLDDDRIV